MFRLAVLSATPNSKSPEVAIRLLMLALYWGVNAIIIQREEVTNVVNRELVFVFY